MRPPRFRLPSRTDTLGQAVDACVRYARENYKDFTDAMEAEIRDAVAFCGGIPTETSKEFHALFPSSRKGVHFTVWRIDGRYEPNCYKL